MKKQHKIPLIKLITIMFPALITGTLIKNFLSGKIIDIPKGTPLGGMLSAIGVLIIIVSVILLTLLFFKFFKPFKEYQT
jgi:hypothetical protein